MNNLTLSGVWCMVQEARQAIQAAETPQEKENFEYYLTGILTVAAAAGYTQEQIDKFTTIL